MSVRIINADVLDGLRQLPDESVHCVVTSPPYFGLRDYGVEGQIGLEATPDAFVGRLVEVFREARRVLRSDGTLWVNMGDSYNNADKWGGGGANTGKHTKDGNGKVPSWEGVRRKWSGMPGCKPKDLIGVPWMLAFALRTDGWWLRSDIIWSKPNPMPESVTDRPTKAHEYVFLLTKSERYFYDADAIRETADWGFPNSPESIASPYGQGFTRRASAFDDKARSPGTAPQRGMSRIGKKGNSKSFRGGVYTGGKSFDNDGVMVRDSHGNKPNETLSRNKRTVWTIATTPFAEAHFATFPPELPEICIKAGCPVGGTVLDPFGGAGTTGLVADRLQRNAILIELNPEYAAMAERRINRDRGELLKLMEAAQ